MTLPSVVVLVVFLLLLSHYSVNGGSEQPGLGQESLPSITTRVDHHGAWRTRKPLSPSSAHETAQIVVNGDDSIATVDDDFLCGTLDWWPPEKCDYGTCSWGNASLLNLDITNPLLETALSALAPLKIRLGGSLQDQVVYDVGIDAGACTPLLPNNSEMFGFSGGCLSMSRWDSLNRLFRRTRSTVAFGLNALYGRLRLLDGSYAGSWDPSNARNFVQYTVDRGHEVQAWELGNELGGQGVGTTISAKQFAEDVAKLRTIIREIYSEAPRKPLLVAPDSFFDRTWYTELFDITGDGVVDVSSRHIYNLGPGRDTGLVDKILNPEYIGREAVTYDAVQTLLAKHAPSTVAWIGEAGGAYNSGRHLVTDSFVSGFWYVDELGMAAKFNNKAFCRQSIIGGNYGLLNTTTFHPNPDFYMALLWSRLAGNTVLETQLQPAIPYLRMYAHCNKEDQESVTLILLNYSNQTQYNIYISVSGQVADKQGGGSEPARPLHSLLSEQPLQARPRLEYHLTADSLLSQTVRLNGQPLLVTPEGKLPALEPEEIPVAPVRLQNGPNLKVTTAIQDGPQWKVNYHSSAILALASVSLTRNS